MRYRASRSTRQTHQTWLTAKRSADPTARDSPRARRAPPSLPRDCALIAWSKEHEHIEHNELNRAPSDPVIDRLSTQGERSQRPATQNRSRSKPKTSIKRWLASWNFARSICVRALCCNRVGQSSSGDVVALPAFRKFLQANMPSL
jgi:hypothetical protein